MRRNWVTASALAVGLSASGLMVASSAEDGRVVLPPPSLYDGSAPQARAVDSSNAKPAAAVVSAKPSTMGRMGVMAEASGEDSMRPETSSESVWWKPWTWFSRKAAPHTEEPAQATQTIVSREGYAVDSPAKKIRTGMGDCLKTGTWVGGHEATPCDGSTVTQEALSAPASVPSATKPTASREQTTVRAEVPAAQVQERNPVQVSAIAPERDVQRRPIPAPEPFESIRVQSGEPATQEQFAQPVPSSPAEGVSDKPASAKASRPAPDLPAPAVSDQGADRPLSMSAEALFGFKSSKLLWAGKKQLDEVATRLSDGDYQRVRVVGHTDKIGTPQRNRILSLRRAKAVKDYLVMKGVEPERIDVEGRGADQPITHAGQCDKLSAKARAACMAPDRRVEIVVTRSFAKKKSDFQASR